MKIPKRGEKGFTLVELLIVLAILAVLAAVVIPNVTGMMGRGSEQSFKTDEKTIGTAVQTFYFDPHAGNAPANWNEKGEPAHRYPTETGTAPDIEPSDYEEGRDGLFTVDGEDGVIWMGLLVNAPADPVGVDGTVAEESTAHPLIYDLDGKKVTEHGPYLNEIPQSAGTGNGGTEGTYIWICGASGKVFAVYLNEGKYYAGFGDTYP